MKCKTWTVVSIAAIVVAVSFLAVAPAKPTTDKHEVKGLDRGVAVLTPTRGSEVGGTITLHEEDGVVHVAGEIRGLTPGLHGFHIHKYGDLRSADGKSAGGHYNPCGTPHAGPNEEVRHVGDLGNVEADQNGVAKVHKKIDGVHLHFLFGRSIVVHAGEDDQKSQPSGNAGPRVAIGVIGIAK